MNEEIGPSSLIEQFRRTAREHPSRLAVSHSRSRVTYAELVGGVDRMHANLERHGASGLVSAILLGSGTAYVASILSVASVRGVFAALEPSWPDARIIEVLARASPRVVFAHVGQAARILGLLADAKVAATVLEVDDVGQLVAEHANEPNESGGTTVNDLQESWENDSLYLVFTSGSTGTPNAVEGAHLSLAHFIAWQVRTFALDETCRVAQLAPTTFDVSLRDIFVPLVTGGTSFIPSTAERYHPVLFPRWLAKHQINLIHVVPSAFRPSVQTVASSEALRGSLGSLRWVIFSGERLVGRDVALLREQLDQAAEIVNFYGPSESTLIKSFFRADRELAYSSSDVVPLGQPLPECVIRVCDERGQELPRGATGEIVLESPYLAKGYFRNESLTKQKFSAPYAPRALRRYRTGDGGYVDQDGHLRFVGRLDQQVKVHGNRVELGEVECHVLALEGVESAVVLARSKVTDGEVVLVCAFSAKTQVSLSDLRSALRARLPSYMVPSTFVQLAEMPLLPSGKADRKSVGALILTSSFQEQHNEPARDAYRRHVPANPRNSESAS